MKSQPSSPQAIPSGTHPVPHHRPILPNLNPTIVKHHHKAKAGQISISTHLANVKEIEATWYQRIRQIEMDAKQDKDKLYLDAKQDKDKLYREIIGHVAENNRLQVS